MPKRPNHPTISGRSLNTHPSKTLAPSNTPLHQYLNAATSDNTRKAYRSAIRQFERWGGRLPTDRQHIVQYLLHKAEQLNPRTLALHLSAISQWHQTQSMSDPTQDPTVRATLRGIQRTHGQPKRKAKALRLEHIAKMLQSLQQQPASLKRARDKALLLVGFFGAFRRSELVAIQVEDLRWEPEGLIVQLPRSKTDQQGGGLARALPFADDVSLCPADSLRTWLQTAGIDHGPIFRPINRWDHIQPKALGAGSVNTLLKHLAAECGLDFAPELSSHSFRRGLSTSAAREQVSFELIKKQGGWKSDATVREYIEEGQQLSENAASPLMRRLAQLLQEN